MSYTVIGIDPAPSKATAVYDGVSWSECSPQGLRVRVSGLNAPAIVAWDAPLSFDRSDFYGRTVDETAKLWAGKMAGSGHFERNAVNARAFAGLPHWAVTCEALGMPFGQKPPGFDLATTPPSENSSVIAVIEVHPAVALAIWWLDEKVSTPFPKYKGKGLRNASGEISKALGFPNQAGTSDDFLDAYVAYRIGMMFRDGKAHWLGNPADGGYVLPDSPITDALREEYVTIRAKRLEGRKGKGPNH